MDTDSIRPLALKFKRARSNLLLLIAFSAANLLLTALNASFYLLFSATAPQYVFAIGQMLAESNRNSIFLVVGLVIAVVILLLYLICWVFSKRRRGFLIAALVLFIFDTLMLGLLIWDVGFEASFLLDIAFHVWILYYLFSGATACSKLRGVSADAVQAALDEAPAMGFSPQSAGEMPAAGAMEGEPWQGEGRGASEDGGSLPPEDDTQGRP